MINNAFTTASLFIFLILVSGEIDAMSISRAKELVHSAQENHGTKALSQLEKAAYGGDPIAQDWLGRYFLELEVTSDFSLPPDQDRQRKDRELEQNDAKAAEWFRKSADQGNADAQVNLGVLYENGDGVQQDYSKAAGWFMKSADQGNADVEVNLGLMYYYGDGVPKNFMKAVDLFSKAAEQNDAYGKFYLGLTYVTGPGVTKNNLIIEALGHGVPHDNVIAYALFNLVASKDISDSIGASGFRDRLAMKMTDSQIKAAQSLSLMMQQIGVIKATTKYNNNSATYKGN